MSTAALLRRVEKLEAEDNRIIGVLWRTPRDRRPVPAGHLVIRWEPSAADIASTSEKG